MKLQNNNLFSLIIFLAFTVFTSLGYAQRTNADLEAIINSEYNSNEPGATFLVAKNGKAIFTKAIGKADMELDVDMSIDNVFEIGSITKQFTAVAILMLEEQGKLSVEDPITKFLPDYPTLGKTINIHHLLNHTSGIKSYTAMPNLRKFARNDMTPVEMIDMFKNEPMDFDPGEKFLYNNSGYFILGYIIEHVSGMSYEDYIEKNIFQKINMNNSYYGSMKDIIKNRAEGYSQNEKGYRNADFLSLTIPYAAGSLMSTVEDLLKWQNAVRDNVFIKRSSLEKAINGSQLNDGTKIPYGYGWGKNSFRGKTSIAHSGGIFGYTSNGIYLPEDDIYIIGLSNCDCKRIGQTTYKLAAAVLGEPFPNISDIISLSEDKLKRWVGTYEFKEENTFRYISLEDGQLKSQRKDSEILAIYPLSETRFMFEDGMVEYNFEENDGIIQVKMITPEGVNNGILTQKSTPQPKKEMKLSEELLRSYVGTYEITSGFNLEITVEDGRLMTQATGQNKIPIYAEDDSNFFVKAIPASMTFNKNSEGKVTSLTLHQGGRDTEAKKIN